jgi:hypothetical protein
MVNLLKKIFGKKNSRELARREPSVYRKILVEYPERPPKNLRVIRINHEYCFGRRNYGRNS